MNYPIQKPFLRARKREHTGFLSFGDVGTPRWIAFSPSSLSSQTAALFSLALQADDAPPGLNEPQMFRKKV